MSLLNHSPYRPPVGSWHWAFERLLEGKTIRRPNWPPGDTVQLRDRQLRIVHNTWQHDEWVGPEPVLFYPDATAVQDFGVYPRPDPLPAPKPPTPILQGPLGMHPEDAAAVDTRIYRVTGAVGPPGYQPVWVWGRPGSGERARWIPDWQRKLDFPAPGMMLVADAVGPVSEGVLFPRNIRAAGQDIPVDPPEGVHVVKLTREDTAYLIAAIRAAESIRPGSVLHDPYSAELCGSRGPELLESLPSLPGDRWPVIARTWATDQFVAGLLEGGVRTVLDIGAGLSTRPWRLTGPTAEAATWIEVDSEHFLWTKYGDWSRLCRWGLRKTQFWACSDVFDDPFLARLQPARTPGPVLAVTEGLLAYSNHCDVKLLALRLASQPSIRWWIADFASPASFRLFSKTALGRLMRRSGLPFRFSPEEGVRAFVKSCGWETVTYSSTVRVASHLGILPASLKAWAGKDRIGPVWSGVWLMRRAAQGRES